MLEYEITFFCNANLILKFRNGLPFTYVAIVFSPSSENYSGGLYFQFSNPILYAYLDTYYLKISLLWVVNSFFYAFLTVFLKTACKCQKSHYRIFLRMKYSALFLQSTNASLVTDLLLLRGYCRPDQGSIHLQMDPSQSYATRL